MKKRTNLLSEDAIAVSGDWVMSSLPVHKKYTVKEGFLGPVHQLCDIAVVWLFDPLGIPVECETGVTVEVFESL